MTVVLPVVAVVAFGKEAVYVARLKSPDVCHVQINQQRRDVVVHGIHELHVREDGIPHEAVIDHRRGAYQVVEGVLPLVRVHGTELEHPGDRDDGRVVVPVVVPSA